MLIGLFTELTGSGGVQRAGRHLAAVMSEFAASRHMDCRLLSLNDSPELHRMSVGGKEFVFTGCERSKARFTASAIRAARRHAKVVLAGHPNLGPVAQAMKLAAPRLRTIICTHGLEVWEPLPFLRRLALRRANVVLAPSKDTANHAAEQRVRKERIHVLPWALDPEFEAIPANAPQSHLPHGYPEGRVILTVGRWSASERYKGMNTLITAMPRLLTRWPELQLLIVGDGDDRAVGGDGQHAVGLDLLRELDRLRDVDEVDDLADVGIRQRERLRIPVRGGNPEAELLRAQDRRALVASRAEEEDRLHAAPDRSGGALTGPTDVYPQDTSGVRHRTCPDGARLPAQGGERPAQTLFELDFRAPPESAQRRHIDRLQDECRARWRLRDADQALRRTGGRTGETSHLEQSPAGAVPPDVPAAPRAAQRAAACEARRQAARRTRAAARGSRTAAMRELPPQDRPSRLWPGELRRGRQMAHRRCVPTQKRGEKDLADRRVRRVP